MTLIYKWMEPLNTVIILRENMILEITSFLKKNLFYYRFLFISDTVILMQ